MDRGRVGYEAGGNKSICAFTIKTKHFAHRKRLLTVMHREPGSSATLDNMEPKCITATSFNPRKEAIKSDIDKFTYRANRYLFDLSTPGFVFRYNVVDHC